ncbi:MAG: tRNA (guanine(46)-N(7))-methyltransferase TrmB [Rhodospirillales bacterium]
MNAAKQTPPPPSRPHFYGRRRGHKLRPGRQKLLETDFARRRLTPADVERTPGGLLPSLFAVPVRAVWFEVGFGGGEHFAAQAAANPDIGFIGCEPFVNGVAALLGMLDRAGLGNARIFDDDARLLLPVLPENSIDRVFVLFSDPWPKKRHHRRRFLTRPTLDLLARVMKDGAELRFASDHAGYVRWVLEEILRHPDFLWPVQSRRDWTEPPPDWAPTRYEAKARRQGRAAIYVRIRRAPRRAVLAAAPG